MQSAGRIQSEVDAMRDSQLVLCASTLASWARFDTLSLAAEEKRFLRNIPGIWKNAGRLEFQQRRTLRTLVIRAKLEIEKIGVKTPARG
jgi:hypothetical protein